MAQVVSTMAGSVAVALTDRNIAELVKHSTDTIQATLNQEGHRCTAVGLGWTVGFGLVFY